MASTRRELMIFKLLQNHFLKVNFNKSDSGKGDLWYGFDSHYSLKVCFLEHNLIHNLSFRLRSCLKFNPNQVRSKLFITTPDRYNQKELTSQVFVCVHCLCQHRHHRQKGANHSQPKLSSTRGCQQIAGHRLHLDGPSSEGMSPRASHLHWHHRHSPS